MEDGLDLIEAAVEKAGHIGHIRFACDPASSEFFDKESGSYDLSFKDKTFNDVRTSKEMLQLFGKYGLVLLEYPFAEDGWLTSWTESNRGCTIELVGDDLLYTNVERMELASERRACNTLLLKLNQIGTVSEAIEA